ncbi:hypothetical protein FCV25MIE_10161, partial [Fagus crenata]
KTEETRVYRAVVVVVWAKPQVEPWRWWPTKKVAEGLAVDGINLGSGGGGGLGETPGGAVEVVADEEGGGGLGSGRHQFGQWVLLENVVVF